MLLIENCQIVPAFLPVDLGAAAPTSDWVSLAKYRKCQIKFVADAGLAGEDVTLTLLQATDTTGGTSKALNFTRYWTKQDTVLTATGTFTAGTQTAANTLTSATSGETAQVWVIEIDASDLDADGGYTAIQCSVGDVGSASQKYGYLEYVLYEPRESQATPASAL
jgi:hypothetical protein